MEIQAFLSNRHVGKLFLQDDKTLSFEYSKEWLNSPQPYPISLSIPLTEKPSNGKRVSAFFNSLIHNPSNENFSRDNISRLVNSETVGGIVFSSVNSTEINYRSKYAPLSKNSLEAVFSNKELLNENCFKNEWNQTCLGVTLYEGKFYVPKESSPSLFTLKLPSTTVPGLIENEFVVSKIAESLGLRTVPVRLQKQDRLKYLLAERPDRKSNENKVIKTHLESLYTSLGATPQTEDTLYSYKNIVKHIDKYSFYPGRDKMQLIKFIAFSLIAGIHRTSKYTLSLNFNMGTAYLAPFSSLICTEIYEDKQKQISPKVGRIHTFADLSPESLKLLSREIDLPYKLMKSELETMAQNCVSEMNTVLRKFHQDPLLDFQTLDRIRNLISQRCQHIQSVF